MVGPCLGFNTSEVKDRLSRTGQPRATLAACRASPASRPEYSHRRCAWLLSRQLSHSYGGRLNNWCFFATAQGRPLVLHAFALDLPDLGLADPELLNHQASRIGHVDLVVLGLHQCKENFLAPFFGKLLAVRAWRHYSPF